MKAILHDRRFLVACAAVAALLAAAAAFAVLSDQSARRGSSAVSSSGGTRVTYGPATTVGTAEGALAAVPAPAGKVASGDAGGSGSSSSSSSSGDSQLNADLPSTLDAQRFLVRTGDMSVVVAHGDVAEVAAHVIALTQGFGGYVLSSQVSTTDAGQRPFADITVRVPARLYDQAIRRFSGLGRVQGVRTSADDVTGQYVDLQARLAHERKVERRLLGFLQRTRTVDEALAVQSRIDQTELRIEQLAGQLKALHEQVAFGTLTVSVSERGHAAAPPHRNSFLTALLSSWHHLLAGFEAILVGLGAVLPFAVLLAVLAMLAWLAARRAPRPRRQAPAER